MTACADRRGDLGAHLLGVLEPAEVAGLEAHLSDCDSCAAEMADLAGLADLLALATPDRVGAVPAGPDAGFADRLVAAAAHRQRLRRRRWLAGAAAAAIVVGAAATAGAELVGSPAGTPAHAAATAGGVSARVTLQPRASGTAITVQVSGVPAGQECVLLAVARDGRREIAGTWRASYAGTAAVQGTTAIPEGQLVRLVVDTSDGHQLVAVPVGR